MTSLHVELLFYPLYHSGRGKSFRLVHQEHFVHPRKYTGKPGAYHSPGLFKNVGFDRFAS
jgi:hypothetical protein